MNKQPSASNTEAFVRCTASHVLPQHEAYLAQTEDGTDNHELLTGVINRHPGAGAKLAEKMPGLGFKIAEVCDKVENLSGERAYVVDVQKRTSVYLGAEIGREYAQRLGRPLQTYEIGVSLDACGTRNKLPWLRDWKFGTYSSWWQLYIQAMAVLWSPECRNELEVDAGFVHIRDSDGEEFDVTEDTATLYMSDLDDRADELMTAFGRANSMQRELERGMPMSELRTVEGKWCQYCGAYPHCPSKWKLARSMLELDVSAHVAALSAEQCGAAWKKLAEVEKNIIKKTKDALKARMRIEGGFPLENGKMLKVLNMPGRASLDKEATLVMLRKKGVTEGEIVKLFKVGDGYDQVREVKQ